MKKVILLTGYCTPFVFLAMNEDALYGSLWFYLFMIAGFGALSFICGKTENLRIVYAGNILSFISSCVFAWNFQIPKWEYYFKPFLPNQLIIFETVIAVVIQLIIYMTFIRHK